jgi:tRNA-specific 2-thiouridylase
MTAPDATTATAPDATTMTAQDDAKAVCGALGIQHHMVDVSEAFKRHVIDNFTEEYLRGLTPNPCIQCNKHIKFQFMADMTSEAGFEYIATGHYAGITVYPETGRYAVTKSDAGKKDQSYFLYGLSQRHLKHLIFPLARMNKDEIRLTAKRYGLPVADKSDSQEICFIPDGDYGRYLTDHAGLVTARPGNFVSPGGEILGKHRGVPFYTVGQRKGLGIAKGKPLYVVRLNAEKNEIVLGDEGDLYHDELIISDVNLQALEAVDSEIAVTVKIRNQSNEASARLIPLTHTDTTPTLKIVFETPQRAITPGQSAVFYIGGMLIGGGIIMA